MKRGAPNHPKVYELMGHLDIPKYVAVGLLESLWHFAQQYAQAGDIGRHTDEAIARAIGWEGNAATLMSAFVKSGWVDRCRCHRARVHDWPTHADQTVSRSEVVKKQGFLRCYDYPSSVLARDEPAVAVAVALPEPTPEPKPKPGQATPALTRHGLPGEAEAVVTEAKAELAALSGATGRPQDELLAEHSNTGRGALVRLEGAPLPWLKVTRDRLKAARLIAQGANRPPPRTEKQARSLDRALRFAGAGGLDASEQRSLEPRDVGTGATPLARGIAGTGEPERRGLPPGDSAEPDGPSVALRRR